MPTAQELTLGTTVDSVIENLDDLVYGGKEEDHNFYELNIIKGHKYTFDLTSSTQFRNSIGIDQFNNVMMTFRDDSGRKLDDSDNFQVDNTIAGSTKVTFVAQNTGTYILDIFGLAGFGETTEYGEATRIDTPFSITTEESTDPVDLYANKKNLANTISLDQVKTVDGVDFSYGTVTNSSIYDSINDSDWFEFTGVANKDYKITVSTTGLGTDEGVYKRITPDSATGASFEVGGIKVVAGKDTPTTEQYYYFSQDDSAMIFEVTGGRGDYEVTVEEAIIDPEENIVTEAQVLELNTIHEGNKYATFDYEFFKLENLTNDAVYKVTVMTDELNSSQRNDNYYISGFFNTDGGEGSQADKAHSWGQWMVGHKDIDGGKEFFFQADSVVTDYYINLKDMTYKSTKGDYTIKVEELTDETANSIAQLDTNSVDTLAIGETQEIKSYIGDSDYIKVDLTEAGLYVFKAFSYFDSSIELYSLDGLKSTVGYTEYQYSGTNDDTNLNGSVYTHKYQYNNHDIYSKESQNNIERTLTFEITDGTDGTIDTRGSYYLEVKSNETALETSQLDQKLSSVSNINISYSKVELTDTVGGEDIQTAQAVEVGTTYNSMFHNTSDVDTFKVDLKAGESYKLNTYTPEMSDKFFQLSLSDADGNLLFNNDTARDALTNVFAEVLASAGDNMQKAMAFLNTFDIDVYKALIVKYNNDFLGTTAQEREDFLLYTNTLSKMQAEFNNNDLSVRFTDPDGNPFGVGALIYGDDGYLSYKDIPLDSLTSAQLNTKFTIEILTLTDAGFNSSFDLYVNQLKDFAGKLYDDTVQSQNITQEQIDANYTSLPTVSVNKLSSEDFTPLSSDKDTLNTTIESNDYFAIDSKNTSSQEQLDMLNALKTADYTNASLQDLIEVNKLIHELISALSAEDDILSNNKIYISGTGGKEISSITITDGAGNSHSVTIKDNVTDANYSINDLGDNTQGWDVNLQTLRDTLVNGLWTITTVLADSTELTQEMVRTDSLGYNTDAQYDQEITLGMTARSATGIETKLASDITAILDTINVNSTQLEIADAIGKIEDIKTALVELNGISGDDSYYDTVATTSVKYSSWKATISELAITSAQQTSLDTLYTQLNSSTNAYQTFKDTIDATYSGASDYTTLIDEIQILDNAYLSITNSDFTTEQKSTLYVALEDKKASLINLFTTTELASGLSAYSTVVNATTTIDPILTETQATALSSSLSTTLTDLNNHANAGSNEEGGGADMPGMEPLTLDETIAKLNDIANNTTTISEKITAKQTLGDDWMGLLADSQKIIFDGANVNIYSWMNGTITSVTISDGTNSVVVDTGITEDMMNMRYTMTADLSSLATDVALTVTATDGTNSADSNLYVLSTTKQSEFDTAKTDAIAAANISESDITTEINILNTLDGNSTLNDTIDVYNSLANFKQQLPMDIMLTTAQQAVIENIKVSLSYTNIMETLNTIESFDYSSSSSDILIETWAELSPILGLKDNWDFTFSDDEKTNISNKVDAIKIILQETFTYDMINNALTSYATIASDTNSTTQQVIDATNEINKLNEIIYALNPSNSANDYGPTTVMQNATGVSMDLDGTTYNFTNSTYQDAQADFETLVNILNKLDLNSLAEYKDTYINDLFSSATPTDFTALIDGFHGSSWYSGSGSDTYAITQDGTYYLQYDYAFPGAHLVAGEYSFDIESIDSSDAGDTIDTSIDFVELDKKYIANNSITARFNDTTDKDMYSYEFEADSQYTLKLNYLGANLKIYDSLGNRIITTSDGELQKTNNRTEDYEFEPTVAGTYYVEISKGNSTSTATDYTLTIEDINARDSVGSSMKKAADYANVMSDELLKTNSFVLDYEKDTDWYMINTVRGNTYTIDLDSETMKFMDIKIFDANGEEVIDNASLKTKEHLHFDDLDHDVNYLKTNWQVGTVENPAVDSSINLYAHYGIQNQDTKISADGKTYYIQVSNNSEVGAYTLDVSIDTNADDYGSALSSAGNFKDIDTDLDGIINAKFEKRNDTDMFKYSWEKAIYEVVIDSTNVDKIMLEFYNDFDGELLSMSGYTFDVVENFVANRADTDGSSMNYLITSNSFINSSSLLSLKNTFGAGDYTVKINKIADLDTTPIDIILSESIYTNETDAILYQSDVSNYNIEATEGKTYQIELNSTADATALGQLIITITDENGNSVDMLKEWKPTGVMTRVNFTAETSQKYSIEVKTANDTGIGSFSFNMQELDMSGDIGSTLDNHGDFNALAVDGVVSSDLNPSIDRDWFKYSFVEGTQYLISVDMSSSDTGLVYIYDSQGNIYNGNQMWDTNDNLSTSDKTILFNPTKSDDFYLSVANAIGGDYTLKVEEYVDTNDISANTSTTAVLDQSTNPSQVLTSIIDNKDDRDWIKVSLTQGQVYKIETTPAGDKMPIPLDLVINGIFDSSGTLLEGSSSVNGIQYIKPDVTGEYFIEIAGKNDTLGYYDVQVTQDTTTDAVSADSTTDQVVTLDTQYKGKIDYLFDKDWIKVSLEAGKKYDISMKGNTLNDTHITGIYQANGTTLIANSSNNNDGQYTLDSKVTLDLTQETQNLDYFIEASGYGDLKGTYTIDVSENTSEDADLSETSGSDTNNTTTTAIDGTLGRYKYGEINHGADTDWFAYEFEAGVTYEINMYGVDSNLGTLSNSFIASIRDSSGTEIAGYSNAHGGKGNDSFLTFTADTAGIYYVEAASQYWTQGSFKLNVKEQGGGLGDIEGVSGSHTMMVYLGGDNNLEQYMLDDLIEMQIGSLPDDWNVTFLIDRIDGYSTQFGDWTDTRQGIIKFVDPDTVDGATTEIHSTMTSLGELNTGDGETLTNFINWSAMMAEASSYSLVLTNHGGGVPGSVWDDTNGHDNLLIDELTTSIAASTVHQNALLTGDKGFELIGFDTCLQGVIDQQYALKDVTDIVLASEEVSWSDYWDYTSWFEKISEVYDTNNGVVTGEDMAVKYVETIVETQIEGTSRDTTISVVDTTQLDNLVEKVGIMNNLLGEVSAEDKQLINTESKKVVIFSDETQMDLGAFANMIDSLDIGGDGIGAIDVAAKDVVAAVSDAVLANATNMTGAGGDAAGIAIHYNGGVYDENYMDNFELAGIMNMEYFFEVV